MKAKLKNWYQAKLLFMEKKGRKIVGLRFYILFKERSFRDADKRAHEIGKSMRYPYPKDGRVTFEFIGVEDLLQTYQAPKDCAMISVLKDQGSQWEDGLRFLRPFSEYEIETLGHSSFCLYLASVVYYVKSENYSIDNRITTCEILVKSNSRNDLLIKVFKFATCSDTLKHVVKIRKDCRGKAKAEFVGIENITPVFDTIRDEMELNRTVENFKSKDELIEMLNGK